LVNGDARYAHCERQFFLRDLILKYSPLKDITRRDRWRNLPAGDTGGVRGLCLEPHDLAISKYVASRDKDRIFTQELARRGLVDREKLPALTDSGHLSRCRNLAGQAKVTGITAASGHESPDSTL